MRALVEINTVLDRVAFALSSSILFEAHLVKMRDVIKSLEDDIDSLSKSNEEKTADQATKLALDTAKEKADHLFLQIMTLLQASQSRIENKTEDENKPSQIFPGLLDDIPDELLQHVLKFLSMDELAQVSLVNEQYNQTVSMFPIGNYRGRLFSAGPLETLVFQYPNQTFSEFSSRVKADITSHRDVMLDIVGMSAELWSYKDAIRQHRGKTYERAGLVMSTVVTLAGLALIFYGSFKKGSNHLFVVGCAVEFFGIIGCLRSKIQADKLVEHKATRSALDARKDTQRQISRLFPPAANVSLERKEEKEEKSANYSNQR